jgi:hypothetical protein
MTPKFRFLSAFRFAFAPLHEPKSRTKVFTQRRKENRMAPSLPLVEREIFLPGKTIHEIH